MTTERRLHTPEFRAQVIAEVKAARAEQKPMRSVCDKHNLSSGMVSSWIKAAETGEAINKKAAKKTNRRYPMIGKYTAEQKAAAVAEWQSGQTKVDEIAKRMGVSTAAVYWWHKVAKTGKAQPYASSQKRLGGKKKKGNGRDVVLVNGRELAAKVRPMPSVEYQTTHEAIALLANLEREALARGRPTKAELYGMIAYRSLTGRD